ncbi:MAG: RIP metalloprotease RseP [Candidatus Dadabacteria bacterium]|nr:RIP metalloprotease RseP [Candidatus Dadabacteria bacterium]
MITILAFIFVIGILVFFHELGHFMLAKRSNIRVEKFSLGFGPKLISFVRGETEYLVSALPLGGYVKMYGDGTETHLIVERVWNPKSLLVSGDRITGIKGMDLKNYTNWEKLLYALERDPVQEKEFEVERDGKVYTIPFNHTELREIEAYYEKDYQRGFSAKSITDRFLVIIAGPAMNFIIPFFFMPLVFMFGISVSSYLENPPDITYVKKDSPAQLSGFAAGDRILSINGKDVNNWKDVNIAVHSNPDSVLEFKVKTADKIRTLTLFAEAGPDGTVETGFARPIAATIAEVSEGLPAWSAGIRSGDKIKAIDGVEVTDWNHMSDIITESKGRELDFTVRRGEKEVSFRLAPQMDEIMGRYIVGITPATDKILKKYGFFESIVKGISEAARMTIDITVLFFGFLFKLITGKIALATAGKTVAGPLLIAKVSGDIAQSGISNLLQFTSLISINLALINLLPIPMLDGGHLLYLGIEKIRRKPLSVKTLEITQRIGFSFLILIMAAAVYNDILRMREDIFSQFSRILDLFR